MSLFRIGAGPVPSYDDPVGMLGHCHRKIEQQVDTLVRSVAALAGGDAAAAGAVRDALAFLLGSGARHTEDEDFSLFPRLRPEADSVLETLETEHRAHEAILLSLKGVFEQDPGSPELATHAEALAKAYREHIALEERALFPLARALPDAELRAIGIEMRLRRGS